MSNPMHSRTLASDLSPPLAMTRRQFSVEVGNPSLLSCDLAHFLPNMASLKIVSSLDVRASAAHPSQC